MKTTLALAALFILVLGGGYAYYNQVNAMPAPYAITSTGAQTVATTTALVVPAATGYTLAQVAANNTTGSCWAAIDGNVYDLTSWINQHPGGKSAILSICGKDGSAAFNGQHGGSGRAQSELATLKLGTLAS
jgi:cytochrome b involved in lipid metabolism